MRSHDRFSLLISIIGSIGFIDAEALALLDTKGTELNRREHGKRKQMPVSGRRSQTHGSGCPIERRLVAQSTEAEHPAPALLQGGPHGRGVQLRTGVQEP